MKCCLAGYLKTENSGKVRETQGPKAWIKGVWGWKQDVWADTFGLWGKDSAHLGGAWRADATSCIKRGHLGHFGHLQLLHQTCLCVAPQGRPVGLFLGIMNPIFMNDPWKILLDVAEKTKFGRYFAWCWLIDDTGCMSSDRAVKRDRERKLK